VCAPDKKKAGEKEERIEFREGAVISQLNSGREKLITRATRLKPKKGGTAMLRKTAISFLCSALLFSVPAFERAGSAASVLTVGDLDVQGVIHSTSGGFRFPDGSTLTSAGGAGTPLAHGVVGAAGNWEDLSHSSNVTLVGHTGVGVYEITVAGESMDFPTHTAVAGMTDTGLGFINNTYTNGHLVVRTFNTGGTAANMPFAFIIMKK
jgi:hypothetical protein